MRLLIASASCREWRRNEHCVELAADLDRAQARNVEQISNSILFTGAEHKALVHAFIERQAAKRKAREP